MVTASLNKPTAYLGPEFKHDVFVSYAHGDPDGIGESELKTWSQDFANRVRNVLRIRPEFSDLDFFLDESRRQGERLDETVSVYEGLQEAASNSALILAVMSQWYPDSEWCRQECDWWSANSSACAPNVVPSFLRAFVCIAQESPEKQTWPSALADTSGRRHKGNIAYDQNAPPLERVPHGSIGDEEDKAAFKRLAVKISADLGQTLLDMREALEGERARIQQLEKIAGLADEQAVIFLHAPEDCEDAFVSASQRLSEAGYVVTPDEHRPLPRDGRLRESDEDDLRASDGLFILVGETRRSINAELVNIGRNVRKLILARENKILPCGVLDPLGPANHPPQRIKNAENLGLEWFDITSKTWTDDVRSWLQECSGLSGQAAQ